jgi:hypothetical protein
MPDPFVSIPLAAVAYITLRIVIRGRPLQWLELLATWLVTAAAVAIVNGGVAHYVSVGEAAGKLAALAIAFGTPLLLAASVARALAPQRPGRVVLAAASLLVGAPAAIVAPFPGVILTCTLTGDCL